MAKPYHFPFGDKVLQFQEAAMRVAARIKAKLNEALRPERLEILDESHRHAGHAGARPEGETHFRLEIVSTAFEGRPRVARQRLIYEILADDLKSDIHALSLQTLTPAEAAARGPGR
ncbi:MAG TPA: BolA family protein [Alphaproteobacteria bacterium]|nr:BolA family protein [Alphaproteobacteria bacterium]